MDASVLQGLLDKGPLGLSVVLCVVIGVLWRQNQGLLREIGDFHKDRAKEISEQVKIVTTVAANSSATIAASTVAMQGNNALLQDVLDVVRVQPVATETMVRLLERNGDKMDRVLDGQRGRP